MTGDGIQRQAQTVRHVLHETSLAAAGRAFDQHRHAVLPGLLEQRLFVTQGLVEGRGMHGCGFDWIHGRIHNEYLTGVIDHAYTLPATRRQAQVFWRLELITVKHAGDELGGVSRGWGQLIQGSPLSGRGWRR
ncbi:hypothetical protein D3C80_1761050 [compost metagenome]